MTRTDDIRASYMENVPSEEGLAGLPKVPEFEGMPRV